MTKGFFRIYFFNNVSKIILGFGWTFRSNFRNRWINSFGGKDDKFFFFCYWKQLLETGPANEKRNSMWIFIPWSSLKILFTQFFFCFFFMDEISHSVTARMNFICSINGKWFQLIDGFFGFIHRLMSSEKENIDRIVIVF